MVSPLRWTAVTTVLSDGWPSHHAILHRQWLTEKCWNTCVQCEICPPSGPGLLPRNFNLSMFSFCVFLKAFLKIRMQKKSVLKMIFFLELRNRSAPLFLNPMENKKNGLSLFLPLFKILKSTRYQSVCFCLHPLPGWNSRMTTKTKKSCSSGHVGLA